MVYSTLLLFLLFGISQSISFLARAPGLNIQKISFPVERNGIKYEFGYYGVVLTFSEDTINIFPNFETLAGLALAAFEEAQALSPSSGGFEGMAVMITGNEAYLASPMRKLSGGSSGGLTYFFYDVLGGNAPLRQQLAACQLSLTEAKGKDIIHKRHNNKANCGEIVNMQMWHMNHPGQTWEGKKDKPVAAAAFWWRESGGKAITPCKGGANTLTWGCMQFLDANGVRQPKSDITRDQVKTLDESQLSKIIKRETLRDMWCQQADNPERLEEPADNVPQGNPEPITQEELDQFEFETDIEFSD